MIIYEFFVPFLRNGGMVIIGSTHVEPFRGSDFTGTPHRL